MKKIVKTLLIFIATHQSIAMHEATPARNRRAHNHNAIQSDQPNVFFNAQGQKVSELVSDPSGKTLVKYYSYHLDKNLPFHDEIEMPDGSMVATEYNDATGVRLSQSLKNTDSSSVEIIFDHTGNKPIQQNTYNAANKLEQAIHFRHDGKTKKSKLTNNPNGSKVYSTYGLTGKREQSTWTEPDGSTIKVHYWFDGITPKSQKIFDAQGKEIGHNFFQHPSLQ